MARKIAGQDAVKLYMRLRWLFDHISGSMYSFGLASFVDQENIKSASVDCSGDIQKIHMRKIDPSQGVTHDDKNDRFRD